MVPSGRSLSPSDRRVVEQPMQAVSSSSVMFGSETIFSYSNKSNRLGVRCGLRTASSTRSSSMSPDSLAPGRFPEHEAPTMCMRISEEALPPSTERSWMRTTRAPLRAAARAAQTPATPPPTTQKSVSRCSTETIRRLLVMSLLLALWTEEPGSGQISQRLNDPLAVFEHHQHLTDGRDVGQRVRIQHDQIGQFARLHRSDLAGQT